MGNRPACFTDISVTSFYGSHIITAGGGGGMLCVNDSRWNKELRILRGWGRSSAADEELSIEERFSYLLDGKQHDAKFIFEKLAYNFMPSEMGAAFGLAQVAKLASFTKLRQKNFSELRSFFGRYQDLFNLPKQADNVSTAWLAYPVTIKKNAPFTRNDLAIYLEKQGIQTRPVFSGNILKHPAFQDIPHRLASDTFPIADSVQTNSLLVGCHHGMSNDDLDYIKNCFSAFISENT